MTSERFYQLSERLLEAADYLAGEDDTTAARLSEAHLLVIALGDKEASAEREQRLQPELLGLGIR